MSTLHAPDPAARPGHPSSRRVILQVGLAALAIAAIFRVTVESSSRPSTALVDQALRQGAERLLSLQRADGLWPAEIDGPGDLPGSGRPARALLATWRTTHDARYLKAARRAADAIIPRLPSNERARTVGNLMLIAELGHVTGDETLVEIARDQWALRRSAAERLDGAFAAETLMARPNITAWLDGSWRNYLLSRAADEVELARLVGETRWAEAFAVTAAGSWAPKQDYDFFASATAGMVHALAAGRSGESQRLASVELEMLRHDELAPGLVWSDSPYDSYVYASETAVVLRGLVASGKPDARRAAADAALLVASRQASHGGWGEVLSLFDQVASEGSAEAPAAELAVAESPELDADIVLALAELLRAPVMPVPTT